MTQQNADYAPGAPVCSDGNPHTFDTTKTTHTDVDERAYVACDRCGLLLDDIGPAGTVEYQDSVYVGNQARYDRPAHVLVKVRAEIVVKVPNVYPNAQATDGMNEGFRAAPDFYVDWSYDMATLQVLSLDPETYEEGDAWGTCPTCGALYGEMGHDPEPCLPTEDGANATAPAAALAWYQLHRDREPLDQGYDNVPGTATASHWGEIGPDGGQQPWSWAILATDDYEIWEVDGGGADTEAEAKAIVEAWRPPGDDRSPVSRGGA